jgi:hypothetical protein
MLKKGEVDDNADDDNEVRFTVSQKCATATLSTEEYFLLTQYFDISPHMSREVRGVGQVGQTVNAILICRQSLGSQLPARPPYCKTGFINQYNYFGTGKDE